MQLDPNSVRAGYAAAMQKMSGELAAFRVESATAYAELRRELDAALHQVRQTQLEFLAYRQSVTHDREQLAELARDRMVVQAQLAERDPMMPLQ